MKRNSKHKEVKEIPALFIIGEQISRELGKGRGKWKGYESSKGKAVGGIVKNERNAPGARVFDWRQWSKKKENSI